MVGLDTNVLVRLATKDDPKQAARARDLLIAEPQLFVNRATVLEFVWVLDYVYEYTRDQIVATLVRLVNLEKILVEDRLVVEAATNLFARGVDFADALFAESNAAKGCVTTCAFDKAAAKRLANMTSL